MIRLRRVMIGASIVDDNRFQGSLTRLAEVASDESVLAREAARFLVHMMTVAIMLFGLSIFLVRIRQRCVRVAALCSLAQRPPALQHAAGTRSRTWLTSQLAC